MLCRQKKLRNYSKDILQNNKSKESDEKIVIEFNLSKAVIILIAIGMLIAAITTIKIVKTLQEGQTNNLTANEKISETNEEDAPIENQSKINSASTRTNTKYESYIYVNSNTVSLRERGKTRLVIRNIFDSVLIDENDLTIEWIIESDDGGEIEIQKDESENKTYVQGKKVGIVRLKAKVTYGEKTLESNTETITIKERLDIYYLPVTLFKYDSKALFESGGSVTDIEKQGIYFTDQDAIPGLSKFALSRWNVWDSGHPKDAYTGLVKNELDKNGNIVFTKPDYGIFDESNTNGKQVYTNVGLPLEPAGNGFYSLKSNEKDVYFENGIPKSNTNLLFKEGKTTYTTVYNKKVTGFFPFNEPVEGLGVYHFGMHAKMPFYMTRDGKTNILNSTEDIVFDFSGDDDIWIFIDGKLVIDLGGIHDELAADINFATGVVNVYKGVKSTNQIAKTQNLVDILGSDWNDDVTEQHYLELFYLERGGGGSNCAIYFNMPEEVQKADVLVHHYIDGTTEKLAEDELITGRVGRLYETNPSSSIPPIYEVVNEKISVDAMGIMKREDQEVTYYYRLKEQTSINKDGTAKIT